MMTTMISEELEAFHDISLDVEKQNKYHTCIAKMYLCKMIDKPVKTIFKMVSNKIYKRKK